MNKFKEVLFSVLPVTLIVLILNFTVAPIAPHLIWRFIVGAILIIAGLSIFLFGADLGIGPIGELMGSSLAKKKKVWLTVLFGFILGFFVTIAEPDLQILAGQVNDVTSGMLSKLSILIVVSVGVGILFVVGLMRGVFNISLSKLFTILYGIVLILAFFSPSEFLGIAFDASGATTGAMAVPFMLALGLGVATVKGGSHSEEESFGMVGIASVGPILAILAMSILSKKDTLTGSLAYDHINSTSVFLPFIDAISHVFKEVIIALLPLIVIFLAFQVFLIKLSKRKLLKIIKGLLYTFVGLVLFLTGVNAGFMEAGSAIGYKVGSLEYSWIIVPIGFILGLVVILAEPAVYVLNEQIENVTSGHIRKRTILTALSIGVAFAVGLSMLRIMIPGIKLWHYILPGFLISVVMSYFVPEIFIGIAFDSGGVASGPMTATFILAFAQGAAEAIEGANVLVDAFGVISLVAMTPLIAIQILGLIYKRKAVKEVV